MQARCPDQNNRSSISRNQYFVKQGCSTYPLFGLSDFIFQRVCTLSIQQYKLRYMLRTTSIECRKGWPYISTNPGQIYLRHASSDLFNNVQTGLCRFQECNPQRPGIETWSRRYVTCYRSSRWIEEQYVLHHVSRSGQL